MQCKSNAVALVVTVVTLSLASCAHAQGLGQHQPVPYGAQCNYSSDCVLGFVCHLDSTAPMRSCRCQEFMIPSDDQMECLRDIGAACKIPSDCTLRYKLQNERTCGATGVCECTGYGDCGGGHGSGSTNAPWTDPTPRITPRSTTTARPIRAAGALGAGGKSGTTRFVASSFLLLLVAFVSTINY